MQLKKGLYGVGYPFSYKMEKLSRVNNRALLIRYDQQGGDDA